jgi:hypothetical protein
VVLSVAERLALRRHQDVDGDRFFTPLDHPEIWFKQGDPTICFSPLG